MSSGVFGGSVAAVDSFGILLKGRGTFLLSSCEDSYYNTREGMAVFRIYW